MAERSSAGAANALPVPKRVVMAATTQIGILVERVAWDIISAPRIRSSRSGELRRNAADRAFTVEDDGMRRCRSSQLNASGTCGAGWGGAAVPIMRNREERGQRLAEDDEVDGNRSGKGSKRGGAMQELPGMGDLLAERAVR